MDELRFHKYEGLGNDFVVVDAEREDAVTPARARAICDRHFGVGADGVLLVLPPRTPGAAARMKVINADGSVPEMCGNGLRCVVVHAAKGKEGELVFDTDAGPKTCLVDGGGVTVDMGRIVVGEDVALEVGGERWTFTLADAGNPHAIAFGDATRAVAERIGPVVATHARFPGGTNVEIARFSERRADLWVWERGVGITLACGTGACATVAAGVAKGRVRAGDDVTVKLPGGELHVTIDARGHAIMRGPAHHVFSGTTTLGRGHP